MSKLTPQTPIVPSSIADFLEANDYGVAETEDFNAYSTLVGEDGITYINMALVFTEGEIILKWQYNAEEDIFIVNILGENYEVNSPVKLIVV